MDTAFMLETADDKLTFDAASGRLTSFRSKAAPEQEFITSAPEHPVFIIQYLDADREYRQVDSLDASETQIECGKSGDETILSMKFAQVGGFDLDVTATVRASKSRPLSRWNIAVRNAAGLEIVAVQYPFVVCSYELGGRHGSETLLVTDRYGRLIHEPKPPLLGPDCPRYWQLGPHDLSHNHYPGRQFAQIQAYYNDRAGLYFACEDAEGNIKRFGCPHRAPGFRIGVAHIGDWPTDGERTLEYDTVLGSFVGDWYQAAEMYRDWTLKQKWAIPLHKRDDVPSWLLDSPPHLYLSLQGQNDFGPTDINEKFQPYEKIVPYVERVADRVDSPVVVVVASWENNGPWIFPDCFPPVGGDSAFADFAKTCRERGWRIGSFGNGTRWVLEHYWSDYDGRQFMDEHDGQKSLCRLPDGTFWRENWDSNWRHSLLQCAGTEMTRDLATDAVRRIIGWGVESLQYLDQNCGAATFACFSPDHEHPTTPGKWMPRKMKQLVSEFHAVARELGETEVVQAVEMSVNECCLPLFQQVDLRLGPPGDRGGPKGALEVVPLYPFLVHECIVTTGGLAPGPEPEDEQIYGAVNCVYGLIPGGVLTGEDESTHELITGFDCWEPRIDHNDDAHEMIRTVTALRRGPGKDFLVYGRMMVPADVQGIKMVTRKHSSKRLPGVFHAAWQSPDGRFAVVLANWTRRGQKVSIKDPRLGDKVTVHTSGRRRTRTVQETESGSLTVSVPPLGCLLAVASD